MSRPIIHAPPGWLFYSYSGPDDDEFLFDAEPIIGWAVDGSYSLPITASEGIVEDTERRIAVAPASTGATWRAFEYSRSYHDEDKARADLELEWRKARDEKLAKADAGEPAASSTRRHRGTRRPLRRDCRRSHHR